MAFMLVMERIEEPLTRVADERDVEDFLDHANPDELDTFVREGTDSALTPVPGAAADPAAGRPAQPS